MRRITPDMPPEVAQKIYWEEGADLQARWMLIDLAEYAFGHQRKCEAASLIHAVEYLKDREAYERQPWPKGCIRLPAAITGGAK